MLIPMIILGKKWILYGKYIRQCEPYKFLVYTLKSKGHENSKMMSSAQKFAL